MIIYLQDTVKLLYKENQEKFQELQKIAVPKETEDGLLYFIIKEE
jgi:hypothetical protein